jgi:hypothetical protein
MDDAAKDAERARIRQEIVRLLEQLGPVQDALAAMTKTARAENWDLDRYKEARAPLEADKARLGNLVKAHQQELAALGPANATRAPEAPTEPVPTFVKFSRARGKVFEQLTQLDAALTEWNCVIRHAVRLERSGQKEDGGLTYAGELPRVDSIAQAASSLAGAGAFALVYLTRDPQALFSIFAFDVQPDSFALSIDLSPRMLVFSNDRFEAGRWLEGLLLEIVRCLNVDVASFGTTAPRQLAHEALAVTEFVALLRDGVRLRDPLPVLHVISSRVLSKPELDRALAQHAPDAAPEYRLAPGYHLVGRIRLDTSE